MPIVQGETRTTADSRAQTNMASLRPYVIILASIWLTFASVGFVWIVLRLHRIFFQLFLAGFLALVLDPAVKRFQKFRIMGRTLNRGLAIAVVMILLLIVFISIGAGIIAPLAGKGLAIAQQTPDYLRQAEEGRGPLGNIVKRFGLEERLRDVGPELTQRLSAIGATVLETLSSIASATFEAILILILAIFLLVEGPRVIQGALSVIPSSVEPAARRIGRTTAQVVSRYTIGILILAIMNGVVTALSLEFTGVQFVLPLALWAGVVDLLPIIGGVIAVVPAALFAFAHSIGSGVIVLLAILGYQQAKNHALYPIVVGRSVNLNPLLVIVAVLVGAELNGIPGALVAIPVAGSLQAIGGEVSIAVREMRTSRAS